MTLTIALVVSVLTVIFKAEFEAWMPHLAERLRRAAVRQMPGSFQARVDEEWSSHLAETPGFIGKVLCAIGFNIAALRISFPDRCNQFARAALWRFANDFVRCSNQMFGLAVKGGGLRRTLAVEAFIFLMGKAGEALVLRSQYSVAEESRALADYEACSYITHLHQQVRAALSLVEDGDWDGVKRFEFRLERP